MFKDLYKSYSESITPSEELIRNVSVGSSKSCGKGFRRYIAVAAAVLLLAVLPVIIFNLNINNSDVVTSDEESSYEFSSNQLKKFCEKKMDAPKGGTAGQISRASIGAWEPRIEYIDDRKIVFTISHGIFVYDYKREVIKRSFDLNKMGVPAFSQGDIASWINVAKNGKYALIYSLYGSEKPMEYRRLDLFSGDVEILNDDKEFTSEYEVYEPEYSEGGGVSEEVQAEIPDYADVVYLISDIYSSDKSNPYENKYFCFIIEQPRSKDITIGQMQMYIIREPSVADPVDSNTVRSVILSKQYIFKDYI